MVSTVSQSKQIMVIWRRILRYHHLSFLSQLPWTTSHQTIGQFRNVVLKWHIKLSYSVLQASIIIGKKVNIRLHKILKTWIRPRKKCLVLPSATDPSQKIIFKKLGSGMHPIFVRLGVFNLFLRKKRWKMHPNLVILGAF